MEKDLEKNVENKPEEKAYITFSEKMIASVREHSDKSKIDTRTGEVMKICAIKLPSKEFRSMQFEKDNNGIERNDRLATINVVQSYVRDNRDKDGKLLNHYTYLDADREYNVNFRGNEIGQENGKKIFDKPEQVKLTGAELTKIFKESREKSQNKKKEKSTKENVKENEKKKAKTKPKKEKKAEITR